MTIRHMLIFQTLCENESNSTKAAEALHMSQPAVSLAIRELEQYYGIRLFDRIGRRLKLTAAGEHFLQYAVHICSLFSDLETGMRDWDSAGLLRVGASITIGSQFLPGYVQAFATLSPSTDVRVTIAPSEQLEKKLLSNELDFALIEGVVQNPFLLSEPYMEDQLCILCPAQSQWRQGEEMPLDAFKKQRFLLREPGSGTREVFDRACAQAGFSVQPAWEAMSTTALVNAVISGLGIAVLPRRMILAPLSRGQVITVHVRELDFRRSCHIIHHRDKYLTSSARRFLELCRNYESDYPLPSYSGLF